METSRIEVTKNVRDYGAKQQFIQFGGSRVEVLVVHSSSMMPMLVGKTPRSVRRNTKELASRGRKRGGLGS